MAMSVVAITTATIWLAGGLSASAADPAGNNGTVMLAGEDLSGTEAHVGCTFTIDFSGFDQGENYADIVLDAQDPTPQGGMLWNDQVFIGEDPAGGGTDPDASVEIDLTAPLSGLPRVDQGIHVKLTVHADGSQGADVKHKTFWVDCDSGGEGGGGGELPG
jgi:hypothetical protein